MKPTRHQSRAGVTLADDPDRSPRAVHSAAHLLYQHFGSVKEAGRNCGLGRDAMNTALHRPDCADTRTVRRVLAGARRLRELLKSAANMEAQRVEEKRLADEDGAAYERCLRCAQPVCLGAAPAVAACLKCGRGLSVNRIVVAEPCAYRKQPKPAAPRSCPVRRDGIGPDAE